MSEAPDFHYPPLDEAKLKLVMRIYENNAGYLDDPKCPYSPETKALLKGQAKAHDFTSHRSDELADTDTLITQINALAQQLKDYGLFINNNAEATPQDKNTYFRLSTALLDKQIEQRDKLANIKQFEQFQAFLLDFMDKEMDADQRFIFMDKIKMMGGLLTTSTSSVTHVDKNKTEGDTQNDLSNPIPAL